MKERQMILSPERLRKVLKTRVRNDIIIQRYFIMAISLNITQIKSFLNSLGFTGTQSGSEYKYGFTHNGYTIHCNFEDDGSGNVIMGEVDYGSDIKIGHTGVCSLSKDEFLVQLECVIRLLKIGYIPNQIELEKTYTLGHKNKGRLDVLVKKGNIPWLMIECKTSGQEYEEELDRVKKNGSQIFSYYAQDRTPSLIGVYASNPLTLAFDFSQISTQKLDKLGSDKDIFKSWDKTFVSPGIFGTGISPYECDSFNLRKKDLKELDRENGNKLYNRFMEILRRYAISDKSNAFSVFFNLFVCKIYDEETKGDEDILDFQWKLADDSITFTNRLSDIYYQSIKQYLSMECDADYYTHFGNGMLFPIKEFSFIEILNVNDFNFNANILVEVVKILQEYKIKYFTRQQFLGDFFENLLNKGFKQESGQFFTPHPLTRFILRALPIDKLIENKIKKREPYILPYTIDFACGGGHFLTEAMLEIEKVFPAVNVGELNGPQRRNFENLKNNYYWAKEYIYGIEKDSRLAKTTKIAMFLNGDGDADIISADGLADFYTNKIYKNKLRNTVEKVSNNNFDLVVSNPPFSVEGFFNTIDNLEMFSLKDSLSPKSCEIECFFLERSLQLLGENGYCGLIFPMSIFNNKNVIYTNARKLLLLNYDIYAITEMREKAFSVTNTTTVIIFARKRTNEELRKILSDFATFSNIQADDIDLMLSNVEVSNQTYLSTDLKDGLIDFIIDNYSHRIIASFSGEKKNQEFFQGYRFSKGRGKEELVETNYGCLIPKEGDYGDSDLASAIHSLFHGHEFTELKGELSKHCAYVNAEDFIDRDSKLIFPPSKFLTSKTIKIESISPIGDIIDEFDSDATTIGDLIKANKVEYIGGLIYDKVDEVPFATDRIVLTASNIDLSKGKLVFDTKLIYLRDTYSISPDLTVKKNDIVISMSSGSLKHLGKVALADSDYDNMMVGGFLGILRCDSEEMANALYYRLMSKEFRKYVFAKKGQNINNLSINDISKISIKLPKDLKTFAEKAIEERNK